MSKLERRVSEIEVPNGSFFLFDFSLASKRQFFDFMSQYITIIPTEVELEMDKSGDVGIGTLDFKAYKTPVGILVEFVEIFINESAFLMGGDHRYLIPITVEHEMTEIWVDLLTLADLGYQGEFRKADGLGHSAAVLAEYKLAAELGLSEDYLILISYWRTLLDEDAAEQFWRENMDAYLTFQKS